MLQTDDDALGLLKSSEYVLVVATLVAAGLAEARLAAVGAVLSLHAATKRTARGRAKIFFMLLLLDRKR
jgi:hypothetical protein